MRIGPVRGRAPRAPGKGSGGAPGRAGRDLSAAISVGVGIAVLMVSTVFFARPIFAAVVALAVVLALYEVTVALRGKGILAPYLPLAAGGVAMQALAYTRGATGLLIGFAATTVGTALAIAVAGASRHRGRDVLASIGVTAYVPLLAGCVVLLARPPDGAERILAFAATTVCSDVGAYAFGVLFGRHFLAPKISPKKTWEGFGGSIGACTLGGALLLPALLDAAVWQGVVFGLALAITATAGDLGESLLKRRLDVKDMGTLLPGHGGVMDRADSLLPAALVSLTLFAAFAPPS